MKKILMILLTGILVLSGAEISFAAKAAGTTILVASDGKGSVSMVWMPADNSWPRGGWRLERVSGGRATVVGARMGPGLNQAALSKLDAKEAAGIREFAGKLQSGALSSDDAQKAAFAFALATAVDQNYGEALGMRHIDKVAERGSVRYRLVELDGNGRAGRSVESAPVDPWTESPLPSGPSAVTAAQTLAGVELTWRTPVQTEGPKVVSYHIERSAQSGESERLTTKPVLIAKSNDKKLAGIVLFTDVKPPVETKVTYLVSGVDLFLRKTAPVKVELFVKDLTALAPPDRIVAKAGKNEAELAWKANPSQNNAGYVIERSQMALGPYETLTPQAIPRSVERYQDTGLYGGSKFFYRIRSINARGELGSPSNPVAAQPSNTIAPPRPEGLAADVGQTRVRLTWHPVPFPVAGYWIERRIEGAGRWERLNESLVREAFFDDITGATPGTRIRYRVLAIALDNQESKPSDEVRVDLADLIPPPVPNITGVSGTGGKAVLRFAPSLPEEKSQQFLVLRAGISRELGIVIGDPLPPHARSFEDEHVEAGKTYWYRIVAVDGAGNRSEPTPSVPVLVGTPPIPKPVKPSVSSQSAPFVHNRITFEAAPEGLLSLVQSRTGQSGDWKTISGPSRGESEVADPEPSAQQPMYYRVVYESPNGARGEASDIIEAKP